MRIEKWLSRPVRSIEFVAWDTETTGLENARIVEVSAVRFQNGKIQQVFPPTLVNPGTPIPEEVSAIHGISNQDVEKAKTFSEIFPQFQSFVGDCLLVAHYASFDLQILRRELERNFLSIPPWFCLDTFSLAKFWLPGKSSYRLCELVGKKAIHRALEDSLCVVELFQKILEQAEKQFGGSITLKELLPKGALLEL